VWQCGSVAVLVAPLTVSHLFCLKKGMDLVKMSFNVSWMANITMLETGEEKSALMDMEAGDHSLNEMPVLKWFFVTCLIIQSAFGTIGNLLVRNFL
jgi:hypothetical protein